MFIFLSKLLPLFFYPLGLTCVLLAVTLVLFWRRPKWAAGLMSIALTVLIFSSNGLVAEWLTRSLEWQNLPPVPVPQAQAIIVLGGGVKSASPPRPWVEVAEAGDRILYGSLLYRQGKAPWLILSGGRIDWQGESTPESEDMAKIAELMGVPRSAILQDTSSFNTYQNAVNVKKILDTQAIKGKVLLVTSALHTPRSLAIFRHLGIDAIATPTDFSITQTAVNQMQTNWQFMILNLLPDVSSLKQTSLALKEYIGLLVYRLKGWL